MGKGRKKQQSRRKKPQSSEAVGTSQPQQQINTGIHTIYVKGDANIGCVNENQRTEEKEGAQTQNSATGDGSSNNTATLIGSINASGAGATVNIYPQGQGISLQKPVEIDDLNCTQLKRYFKNTLCQASPLPWYPEHAWNIHEVYTELALEGSENNFGVEELFKQQDERFPEDESHRILIEGDAGYGKSTLMLKIASDWSKGDSNDTPNYTSPFGLLLVVKLGYVGEDRNLLSYMESIYNEKIDKRLEDVLKSKGAEKVLILLDGYDEANANTKIEVDRIMEKEKMMACHVVLTSRFGHVPDPVKSKALRVTVKGFGREQVTEAVGKFFIKARHLTVTNVEKCCKDELLTPKGARLGKSDDLPSIDFKNVQEISPLLPEEKRLGLDQFKKFMKKLQDDSPYKELAQCPLLCVMLCCLVSECPNSELPKTFSGLYFAMINRNLCRAAKKKAEAARKDAEQWNWVELDGQIHEDHESYLQEFGRLCVVGLKNKSMSFSLFDITGNKKSAKTNDVEVTQLIEAGVLVQDFTDLKKNKNIPCYQVPHRTTAEFLAAYYLSGETNQSLLQQNLLDLFRLNASFNEVAVSLIEMEKPRCLAYAFRVVKFPSNCLTDIPFMKSYFTQHGAAGTWSEFKDALPNELQIKTMDYDIIVSSSKPSLTLFQLVEEFSKMNTGNTNALGSLQPTDCPVSLHVKKTPRLPILLQTLVKSGVFLNSLEFDFDESGISDQMQREVARSLRELLKAGSCPVQLSFKYASPDLIVAVTVAMQEVPKDCRLRSFEFPDLDLLAHTLPLLKVLTEKWLSHLQHLGMPSKYKDYRTVEPFKVSSCELPWYRSPGGILKPIVKGLREPGCSLTSLHLGYCGFFSYRVDLLLEDLMMFATKLVTLRLEGMNLHFDDFRISKYAVKEKCSLKSLHLKESSLILQESLSSEDENKEFLLAWRNVALNLEELTVDNCIFPVELFSWLNLSVPNLRTLSIGRVYKRMPNNISDSYANQLLEALTQSSRESIEELSLLQGFWEENGVLMLHPIREALQRCPGMRKVKLEILVYQKPGSIGPGRSTPLSPSDVEALESNNNYLALLKIVLSVPMLQTLTSPLFFMLWVQIGTFRGIADKATNWPGKRFDSECNSLTLHGLSSEKACHAMHVFREQKLEYDLRYVSDNEYELWFPV